VLGSFLVCIPLQFYYAFTNPFLNELGMTNTAGIQKPGTGVGDRLHADHAVLLRAARREEHAAGRMARVGRALRAVCVWRPRAPGSGCSTSASCSTAVCYDFFFVTGQIYVDKKAPVQIRAAAQGFIYFVTLGVGMFIGSYLSGIIVDAYKTPTGHDWYGVWLIPAAMALAVWCCLRSSSTTGTSGRLKRHESSSLPHDIAVCCGAGALAAGANAQTPQNSRPSTTSCASTTSA
jgi:hypothetical protein